MKKIVILALSLLTFMFCLTGCNLHIGGRYIFDKAEYKPTGDFYVKTSPCIGDAGVIDVISVEAEHKTYKGTGDITIPFTIGFGHLPEVANIYPDKAPGFNAIYSVYDEYMWDGSIDPVWQKIVEYSDSYYSEKYNSTEPRELMALFIVIPRYGDFYPLYKETVYITFPANIQDGDVTIDVEGAHIDLSFKFSRDGDTLKLIED